MQEREYDEWHLRGIQVDTAKNTTAECVEKIMEHVEDFILSAKADKIFATETKWIENSDNIWK